MFFLFLPESIRPYLNPNSLEKHWGGREKRFCMLQA
jgi:hypothetical protein